MIGHLPQPHLLGLARRSTEELMLLVQKSDALAFETLYYRMVPAVRGFLISRAEHGIPLDDAMQEVFCRVWQQRGRFSGGSSAKTYLIGVAKNVVHELSRDAAHTVPLSPDIADQLVAGDEAKEKLGPDDLADVVIRARSMLPGNQSRAIAMVYDQGMSPREAANLLGCTEKALRCRLDRGRRKLHELLGLQLRLTSNDLPFHSPPDHKEP